MRPPPHEGYTLALVPERRIVKTAPTVTVALISACRFGRRVADIADAVMVRIGLVWVGDERTVVEAVEDSVVIGVDIRSAATADSRRGLSRIIRASVQAIGHAIAIRVGLAGAHCRFADVVRRICVAVVALCSVG